jgi:hypothetical protein
MFVGLAARKDGVYHYLLTFDSEYNSQAAYADLPLSASINKMIRRADRVFERLNQTVVDASLGICIQSF